MTNSEHGALPTFAITEIPFSRRGSWLNISPTIGVNEQSDELHIVTHRGGFNPVLRVGARVAGTRVPAVIQANPATLTWRHERGTIEATYQDADTLRFRGVGLDLSLTPVDSYLYADPVDDSFVYNAAVSGHRYRITVLHGAATTASESVALTAGSGESWEIAIEELPSARPPRDRYDAFDRVVARSAAEFTAWLDAIAPWRTDQTPGTALAAYVDWSASVDPSGFLRRPAMLMSKHWMDRVWSWDHCFNALAVAHGDPEFAWDQFMVMFDHQDDSGGLPDLVGHSVLQYNYVKPPIHGWALDRLRRKFRPDHEQLRAALAGLERWTDWWLTYRTIAGGLPHYQHGNDSGWDNATVFDGDKPVSTPDLAAFLVLQMRATADLAETLGESDRATRWIDRADKLTTQLIDSFWTPQGFVARSARTGEAIPSKSLLNTMPIALGNLLPRHIIAGLENQLTQHLTEFGLATEHPGSPEYEADGYWRGPIWAPSTYLVVQGLHDAGLHPLADAISERFRRLCERSGFPENFDALSGAALRDRAYTWTASCYLLLAEEYERGRALR